MCVQWKHYQVCERTCIWITHHFVPSSVPICLPLVICLPLSHLPLVNKYHWVFICLGARDYLKVMTCSSWFPRFPKAGMSAWQCLFALFPSSEGTSEIGFSPALEEHLLRAGTERHREWQCQPHSHGSPVSLHLLTPLPGSPSPDILMWFTPSLYSYLSANIFDHPL